MEQGNANDVALVPVNDFDRLVRIGVHKPNLRTLLIRHVRVPLNAVLVQQLVSVVSLQELRVVFLVLVECCVRIRV